MRDLVADMSAEEIDGLKRGGHDFRKLFAAFQTAKSTRGRRTVILAKTKKGFGMGGAGESRMTAHQAKKLDVGALGLPRRLRFAAQRRAVSQPRFLPPGRRQRGARLSPQAASGAWRLSARPAPLRGAVAAPALETYAGFALRTEGKTMSTTVAVVRLVGNLLKDKRLGPRIVPIVADEARTFGMANLFRQVGIYPSVGQLYEPEDASSMLYYRNRRTASFSRRALLKPALCRRGSQPPPPTACMGSRCCRSIFSTRCSASSASAILFGPPPTSGRVGF